MRDALERLQSAYDRATRPGRSEPEPTIRLATEDASAILAARRPSRDGAMMDALEPTTEAGRTLHERDHAYSRVDAENCISGKGQRCHALAPILAIERDAALAARSEPGAEGLDVKLHPGQHEFRTVCRLCGEDGFLHVSVITHHERVRIDDPRLAETEPKP